MILCSKRAFLNVLTQIWTRDLLLNANYYILDQSIGGRQQSKLRASDDGGFEVFNATNTRRALAGASGYHIHYIEGSALNPSVYESTILTDGVETNVYQAIINELEKDSTKYAIHSSLFEKELEGNKIQICIYFTDSIIIDYGNLMCQYLSKNFGCDIIFLDYLCRSNIRGQAFYPGDKVNALRVIKQVRDYNLLDDFKQNLTTSNLSVTSNLEVWLRHKEWDELIYLYGLLFPEEPLEPGEYTDEMLKRIIVGKCTRGFSVDRHTSVGNLIYSTTDLFGDILDQYDTSSENFSEYDDMDLESMFS